MLCDIITYVLLVTVMFWLTRVSGVIPVTFLVDNIGDSSLRMKYRYLGGQGTKPLAAALKVSNESLSVIPVFFSRVCHIRIGAIKVLRNAFFLEI